MGNAHHHEKMVQYTPLATPDHREKGFVFKGCSIVVAAMKRWPKIVDTYPGTWEDYLRSQYNREARLQDALVVNLGTGDPLTEAEVLVADPYCLAVMYEDGSFSKVWEEPKVDRSKVMRVETPRQSRRQPTLQIQPSPDNIVSQFAFNGLNCLQCGSTLRYIKTKACVPCSKASGRRNVEKIRQLAAEKADRSAVFQN